MWSARYSRCLAVDAGSRRDRLGQPEAERTHTSWATPVEGGVVSAKAAEGGEMSPRTLRFTRARPIDAQRPPQTTPKPSFQQWRAELPTASIRPAGRTLASAAPDLRDQAGHPSSILDNLRPGVACRMLCPGRSGGFARSRPGRREP
jgi:hypothetical protein